MDSRCFAITLRSCGTKCFPRSKSLPKKNTKGRKQMATEAAPSAAVKRTIHVNVPIEKAFRVFTERMGRWWPATHHVGGTPFKDILIEPRVGGRWYEINVEGAES